VSIHAAAYVDPKAELGVDVEIGAGAFVGPRVVVGDGCRIHHRATVTGNTHLGSGCQVFTGAVLGTVPQDIKFQGENTALQIGQRNIFREMVTVHPGTEVGGGKTIIGDDNLLMVGTHIAHDCHIGNHCIIANYTQMAGHVRVEDYVNMGGVVALHHFVTVGKHAFIGAMTRVGADVPPFLIVVSARGTRTEIRMVNGVGLQRCGFTQDQITRLRRVFTELWSRRARISGVPIRDRVEAILHSELCDENVEYLCRFLLRSFAHGRHGRYLESLRSDHTRNHDEKPPLDLNADSQ